MPQALSVMSHLERVLGPERYSRIRNTSVLMVGAGGIGCELLKNLILCGFGNIHAVDLDTITLSNLNRQFLFRQKDIDQSKSLTVVKAVQNFNYNGCKLVGHHGNIMDSEKFPIEWWDQFSYIFNALDNLEARRYVNKMALFLRKPLMESGTTGFDGQIQPIFPYVTECFECQPKVTPKTYPVCTIRSTPSQPIHCITWAKEFLYHQLFDESEDQPQDTDQRRQLEAETSDRAEIDNLLRESNELAELRRMVSEPGSAFAQELIHKIFQVDIERLVNIESLWKTRKVPEPLDLSELQHELDALLHEPRSQTILVKDTSTWTLLENLYVLIRASESLQKRISSGDETCVPFDKDDEDSLNFVVAAANLRSVVFHIDPKTKFDIKQIAGNIIPAIATTNAIISGFSVLASLPFYDQEPRTRGDFGSVSQTASTVFTSIRPNKYVTAAALSQPNPSCPACSLSARGILHVSQKEPPTLGQLAETIKKKYGYEDIALILGKAKLIYDVDFDDNVDRSVVEVSGFESGELLQVQDDNDELENLEFYVSVGERNELPEVVLRRKKSDKENGENGEEEDGKYEHRTSNGTMEPVEIIDDEVEEPPTKRQKISDIID
ncbi:Ubiquitin-activating enzyme [Meyerozyma sp. JA9]|nr:Ubiquitin-activating enzyme [Meyerozyma sp. JA9]